MINVTQTFLPPMTEYIRILERAWKKGWITNNGELLVELERKLKEYIGCDYLLFCSNGTIGLQLALKALEVHGEVITTPFSYVATSNVILWEGCKPVFVDIDPNNYCINPNLIERAITPDTRAILATHVYGFPCDVQRIESVANKHDLKVIYDGAHAFGCRVNGKALLDFGDISVCSFHATKVFHTVEGGCIIPHSEEIYKKLGLYRSFGHLGEKYFSVGVNAKNSEFHAAMGLALLPMINELVTKRRQVHETYSAALAASVKKPIVPEGDFQYNYSYYPAVFRSEKVLLKVQQALLEKGIGTRRYFFPSLNKLPQTEGYWMPCPVSEDVSVRVLCLPIFPTLELSKVNEICSIVNEAVA
jgi:dTDP-4-amino-4,6-dideoxygalactose transaminase